MFSTQCGTIEAMIGLYVCAGLLGMIIGSFLNVVIYRLHTGKSLEGRSHCMSCGETLRWWELIPVLSYIGLRGRCARCSSYISARYMLVELLTGVLFVLVFHTYLFDWPLLILFWSFVSLCVVVVVYDMYHMIIPDSMSVGMMMVAFAYVVFIYSTESATTAALHVLAGIIPALFFAGLWFVSKGRWIGLGDAKIAISLGALVGLSGTFSFVILSFWVGAAISLAVLGGFYVSRLWTRTRRRYANGSMANYSQCLTMKSEIPFAPFLIISFLLVHFFHIDVFEITHTFLVF